ncbi:VanZ family protein [Paenibacillus xerothermodurans]|uniref:VanZ family protein n=1 Tax=Paenibacillus xerothermodurans TaxID=1977292 RepID=A0A2W1N960_PAEXE|nr:VanZ family protein [Paenibacillus xerothermodurans]PZE20464.1 VanZ family protein [Paenibacillus xerothermodurans]
MRGKRRRKRGNAFWTHWLPLLVWLGVIFYMSSQPYETQDLKPWLKRNVPTYALEKHLSGVQFTYAGREISVDSAGATEVIEFFMRKAAHLFEYMVLGLFLFRLLARLAAVPVALQISLALTLSCSYAALDEYHQSFTVNRTPLAADVILDTCGAGLGIMTFYLLRHRTRKGGDTA